MRWSLAKVNSAGTAWAISNRQCLATSPIFPFNISLGLYSRGKSSRANEKDIFSRDWTTSEKEIHGIVLLVTAIISLPSLRIGVLKKWKVSLASETSAKRNRYGMNNSLLYIRGVWSFIRSDLGMTWFGHRSDWRETTFRRCYLSDQYPGLWCQLLTLPLMYREKRGWVPESVLWRKIRPRYRST